jgi:tRNA pseudouridine32 synthase/23S rRNA pseudouridine746 synthase
MDAMTLPSRLQLPPGHWPSLLDGLCARFPRIGARNGRIASRAAACRMRRAGRCAGHALAGGAGNPVLPRGGRRAGDSFAETIVHLDAHLLVADKPHFLPVTPAGGHVRETCWRGWSPAPAMPIWCRCTGWIG